ETALRHGLDEEGFVEGRNVVIEYRYADNQRDRLPALVDDLIRRSVAVIVGNHNAALVAKAATTAVPIVVVTGAAPVRDHLVASLNRPGAHGTGVTFLSIGLGPKPWALVGQVVPKATTIAMLVNPGSPDTEVERRDVQAAAQAIGQQLIILDVTSEREIESAFAALMQRRAGALVAGTGAFNTSHRERIVALAAKHAIPAIYGVREFVAAGGFVSFGARFYRSYP